jgi:hypothetical protein
MQNRTKVPFQNQSCRDNLTPFLVAPPVSGGNSSRGCSGSSEDSVKNSRYQSAKHRLALFIMASIASSQAATFKDVEYLKQGDNDDPGKASNPKYAAVLLLAWPLLFTKSKRVDRQEERCNRTD